MKKSYSSKWKASGLPRKQRKYRYNAPLHTKGKFLGAHLIKELRTKHGMRSIRVRTGDKVRVLRGNWKGHEGKIERVNVEKCKVYITKVETIKKDGATKVPYPINPSNIIITDLDASDKRRLEKKK